MYVIHKDPRIWTCCYINGWCFSLWDKSFVKQLSFCGSISIEMGIFLTKIEKNFNVLENIQAVEIKPTWDLQMSQGLSSSPELIKDLFLFDLNALQLHKDKAILCFHLSSSFITAVPCLSANLQSAVSIFIIMLASQEVINLPKKAWAKAWHESFCITNFLSRMSKLAQQK